MHTMKGNACAGDKQSKVCVTVLLCTNMNGRDWHLLFVIGKSKLPHFSCNYVPVSYKHNAKASMMLDLFAKWLIEFKHNMQEQGKSMLPGHDNCSTALAAAPVLVLRPIFTSKAQPLDMGIIHIFKAAYKHCIVQHILIAVGNPASNLPL